MSNQNGQTGPYREIGARLKEERERLHLLQAEFAQRVGVSKTSQSNYEGGLRVPDATYLAAAAQLGLDVTYVISGMRQLTDEDFVVISRYQVMVSAGGGAFNGSEQQLRGLSFSREWLSKRGLAALNLRVVDVTGDSMAGRLNDGDQVLMNVGDTAPKSGRAFVLRQGDELLVKYCQLLPGGILRVSSENPAYPSYDIDLARTEDVAIIGRVVASMHEW